MKHYAIRNEYLGGNKILGILNYDEESREFSIDVPEDVNEEEAPFLLSAFVKRGERHIGAEWAKKWVESRIVPVGRQNIGQILRENHWERYDEFALLVKNQGRSCQDECYIEEML